MAISKIKVQNTSYSINADTVDGMHAEDFALTRGNYPNLIVGDSDKLGGRLAQDYSTTEHTHDEATPTKAGFISAADKSKLNGIEDNANNYTLPPATATKLGGIKSGDDITVDTQGNVTVKNAYTVDGKHVEDLMLKNSIRPAFKGWIEKDWKNLSNYSAGSVWTDGKGIYYSSSTTHYKLVNGEWEKHTWLGLSSINGSYIWSDGQNIYYSSGSTQYVLSDGIWIKKSWSGLTSFYGNYIWSDGQNIYYSSGSTQYVLNNNTWIQATNWSTLTSFYASYIWTDGEYIYYSNNDAQYILQTSSNRTDWTEYSWTGLTTPVGQYIWTDGKNIYHSYGTAHYKLNGSNWEEITWNNLTSFSGSGIWTDGQNIYFSQGSRQYILSALNGATPMLNKTYNVPPDEPSNVTIGNWTIEASGTTLYFKYDATTVATLTSSGIFDLK